MHESLVSNEKLTTPKLLAIVDTGKQRHLFPVPVRKSISFSILCCMAIDNIRTSVSGLLIITSLCVAAACLACRINGVSASSWLLRRRDTSTLLTQSLGDSPAYKT